MLKWESYNPAYNIEAETPLCALLVTYLLNIGKTEIKSYPHGDITIPKLETNALLNLYLGNVYSGMSMWDLFMAYYRTHKEDFLHTLKSFQPGTVEDTDFYAHENPHEDIDSDGVKKTRTFETHADAIYVFVNYITIKQGLIEGKFIIL